MHNTKPLTCCPLNNAHIKYVCVTCGIGELLRNYVVEALLPPLSSAALCAKVGGKIYDAKAKRYVRCNQGTVGRIVRIRSEDWHKGTLMLCEVEVYGGKHKLNIYYDKIGNMLRKSSTHFY